LRIRKLAREADELDIEERIERITTIFTSFRNPDKETVLTPWRVVNMHMADTIGGWCFYDEDFNERLSEPRFVRQDKVTSEVFNKDSHVLEINSKSGLYPLYVAYSIFRDIKDRDQMSWMITDTALEDRLARHHKIWDEVLKNNLFIICKTPMAKSITRRTLAGFREGVKVNAHYFEDLINQITNKKQQFIERVTNAQGYWGLKNIKEMKFNAIVGNPPYQIIVHNGPQAAQATPVYNSFVDIAKQISPSYISMIMPARWYAGGMGMVDFRRDMLNDKRMQHLVDFPKSRDCFPTVDIAGGLCYFLWNSNYQGNCQVVNCSGGNYSIVVRSLNEFPIFVRENIGISIIRKLQLSNNLSSIVYPISPFGLPTNVEGVENPFDGSYKLISSRGESYIHKDQIQNQMLADQYKVIIGQLNPDRGGVNNTSDGKSNVTTKVSVLDPKVVTTATYIVLGGFDSKDVANNYAKYIRTIFVRYLIFQTLSSMHITQSNFQFVPVQNFTNNSDIDWSKSVAEIDQQLYDKYDLSADEREFIEKMIKPM